LDVANLGVGEVIRSSLPSKADRLFQEFSQAVAELLHSGWALQPITTPACPYVARAESTPGDRELMVSLIGDCLIGAAVPAHHGSAPLLELPTPRQWGAGGGKWLAIVVLAPDVFKAITDETVKQVA
jgi:hypothetical protein